MAKLMMTVDLSPEAVYNLVETALRGQNCDAQVKFGHVSENGQHIEIQGNKPDLLKIQEAFKQKGHTSSVFD